MAKRIPLTNRSVAIVDDADYDWLSQHPWFFTGSSGNRGSRGYAEVELKREGELGRVWRCRISMHRLITEAPKGVMVDHINGDGLDNRRENLRLAHGNGNYQNKAPFRRKMSSPYKGVCKTKPLKDGSLRWVAYCARKHLGSFPTQEEAARAYDRAASEAFGEWAYLNFP